MAIKKFSDFDTVKPFGESETLPRGGYVCKIIGAKIVDFGNGQSVKVAFDIAEGEHSGYYKRKYDNNTNEDKKWGGTFLLNVPKDDGSERDGWTKSRFKTFTDALETSNDGYHFDWDEQKFVGKMVGFIFNYREWENGSNHGWMPNAARVASVEAIRKGDFKIPEDRPLKNRKSTQQTDSSGFMTIPEGQEPVFDF